MTLAAKSVKRVCRLLQIKEDFDIMVESKSGKMFQKVPNWKFRFKMLSISGGRNNEKD
jgi:hypothetical protein